MPKSNVDFWQSKIDRNVARGAVAMKALNKDGWKPRIIWECDLDAGTRRVLHELERFKLKDAIIPI